MQQAKSEDALGDEGVLIAQPPRDAQRLFVAFFRPGVLRNRRSSQRACAACLLKSAAYCYPVAAEMADQSARAACPELFQNAI